MTATMPVPTSLSSCPPRYGTQRDLERATLGPHVARIAELLGKPFMPWQRHVVDVALEVDDDGRLVYDQVVLTVPRQSGKTTLLLPLLVHRAVADFPGGNLDAGPQKQTIVYTAQTRNDARKKWVKEFTPLLERSPFRHQFTKRLTNGSEGYNWSNGSTFDLVATMEKSGHGDTLDLGLIDEAFAQVDARLEQAMEPATATRQCPQLWIVSTAGESAVKSPYLWSKVEAGRELVDDPASGTAYFEWSVGDDEDADDLDVVAARHPAVGHTINRRTLERARDKALKAGNLAGFHRAYGNRWGSALTAREPKIPAEAWSATVVDEPVDVQPGALALAFDITRDGAYASIAVATGDIRDPYVEIIEHRPGAGWLPARLVELVQRWQPFALGCNGAGPSLAMVPSIATALHEAGLDVVVHQMQTRDYKAACGGFYSDVIEGRLRRWHGNPSLDAAAGDATERPLGDAWAWDLRTATVPISPLVAATVARALLPTEAPAAPLPVFAY